MGNSSVRWAVAVAAGLLGIAVVTACSAGGTPSAASTSSASSRPTAQGPPAVQLPNQPVPPSVSVTLVPVGAISTGDVTADVDTLRQRMDFPGTSVTATGRDIVVTGRDVDPAEFATVGGHGVLLMRQVLLQQVPGSGPSQRMGNAHLVQPAVLKLFGKLSCEPGQNPGTWQRQVGYTTAADFDDPAAQIVSCDSGGDKYALSAAPVLGREVISAAAHAQGGSGVQWVVNLTFDAAGGTALSDLTTQMYEQNPPPSPGGAGQPNINDELAVVVDGVVLSAPVVGGPIVGGQAQIFPGPGIGAAGASFTETAARQLAAQLQPTFLPSGYRVGSVSTS